MKPIIAIISVAILLPLRLCDYQNLDYDLRPLNTREKCFEIKLNSLSSPIQICEPTDKKLIEPYQLRSVDQRQQQQQPQILASVQNADYPDSAVLIPATLIQQNDPAISNDDSSLQPRSLVELHYQKGLITDPNQNTQLITKTLSKTYPIKSSLFGHKSQNFNKGAKIQKPHEAILVSCQPGPSTGTAGKLTIDEYPQSPTATTVISFGGSTNQNLNKRPEINTTFGEQAGATLSSQPHQHLYPPQNQILTYLRPQLPQQQPILAEVIQQGPQYYTLYPNSEQYYQIRPASQQSQSTNSYIAARKPNYALNYLGDPYLQPRVDITSDQSNPMALLLPKPEIMGTLQSFNSTSTQVPVKITKLTSETTMTPVLSVDGKNA